jgi:four helix bundle protein
VEAGVRDFRELKIWERSHRLTLEVYKATRQFPKEELYGLTSQMRRAAASIPTNIAEGCGRNGLAELSHFLNIAMGSASELDYHLLLARDLNFLSPLDYDRVAGELDEVKRMLGTYHQKVKATRS